MPEPAVLAQPDTELRELSRNSEDQVSGSDTVLGTHKVSDGPWQWMYQRGLAVLQLGIWHVAIAAGTTQSEAILRRDSEIARRDWDVTATNWIAWKRYS